MKGQIQETGGTTAVTTISTGCRSRDFAWECLRRYVPYQELYSGLVNAATGDRTASRRRRTALGAAISLPGRACPHSLKNTLVAVQRCRCSPLDAPPRISASRLASSADPFAAGRRKPRRRLCRSFSEHDIQVLFLSGTVPDNQLAALVPLDNDVFDRIDALTRLARVWRGRPPPRDKRMTAEQRRRLRLKLRATDGHMNGASSPRSPSRSTARRASTPSPGRHRRCAMPSSPWSKAAWRSSTAAICNCFASAGAHSRAALRGWGF